MYNKKINIRKYLCLCIAFATYFTVFGQTNSYINVLRDEKNQNIRIRLIDSIIEKSFFNFEYMPCAYIIS
ncbi:MAG: hypothetical protein LBT56_05240 [Prevotellaceae bacterium]|nr:hypothetical protein [Prevotellaceae bacterium]